GLFTWDDDAPPYYRELDIEFSRWGEDLAENSQYVVQPHNQPGNRHRFYSMLMGVYSTHGFKWEKDKVDFFSNQGHVPSLGAEIEIWNYVGSNIPSGGAVNARINLWLFNGVPPSNGQKIEVVIESFSHVSAPTTFGDAPSYYWAWDYIERLYNAGITGGCTTSPLMYCPESQVTRAQMAVFLEKGIHGSGLTPPDVSPTFDDTAGHWAEDWIEALKNDGITSGCATGLYCPDSAVTRAQMAVFLLKAKHGSSYAPPNVSATFTDTAGHWAEDWIEQLAAEGITSGCAAGLYCPESPVTRAQMAVFLVKAFGLP
ncbi:MAG: S-layer homology domain-containing protein, partial [Anaerolineales bacterium]|nr:S-layer homology domain-containing protein [Anaerolineales bacterium]